jgi:hypothetical protein
MGGDSAATRFGPLAGRSIFDQRRNLCQPIRGVDLRRSRGRPNLVTRRRETDPREPGAALLFRVDLFREHISQAGESRSDCFAFYCT